jgi:hypothetical protein
VCLAGHDVFVGVSRNQLMPARLDWSGKAATPFSAPIRARGDMHVAWGRWGDARLHDGLVPM